MLCVSFQVLHTGRSEVYLAGVCSTHYTMVQKLAVTLEVPSVGDS